MVLSYSLVSCYNLLFPPSLVVHVYSVHSISLNILELTRVDMFELSILV